MTDAAQDDALPPDWEQRDGPGSYLAALAALRVRHAAGWRPPEGSPFRAREVGE